MEQAVAHLQRRDKKLSRLIQRIGPCQLQLREPDFSSLARSIIFQQLSTKVARVIHGRVLAACGSGECLTPDGILIQELPALRKLGLSQQKATYLRDLADRTRRGEVDFRKLPGLTDEEVIAHLTQVKGVGVWTAHMFLLFALGRPDVLPVGDLGVRTAVRNLYGLPELPTPAELEHIAKRWRPYCSVASWYLWRSLDGPAA